MKDLAMRLALFAWHGRVRASESKIIKFECFGECAQELHAVLSSSVVNMCDTDIHLYEVIRIDGFATLCLGVAPSFVGLQFCCKPLTLDNGVKGGSLSSDNHAHNTPIARCPQIFREILQERVQPFTEWGTRWREMPIVDFENDDFENDDFDNDEVDGYDPPQDSPFRDDDNVDLDDANASPGSYDAVLDVDAEGPLISSEEKIRRGVDERARDTDGVAVHDAERAYIIRKLQLLNHQSSRDHRPKQSEERQADFATIGTIGKGKGSQLHRPPPHCDD